MFEKTRTLFDELALPAVACDRVFLRLRIGSHPNAGTAWRTRHIAGCRFFADGIGAHGSGSVLTVSDHILAEQ